jgi:S1-C subfamily serine protease
MSRFPQLHGLLLLVSLALAPGAMPALTTAEVENSLVRIRATVQRPDYRVPWNPGRLGQGVGSGFLIEGNRIMTNAHVASDTRFLSVEKNGDPRQYPARVVFVAHDCDLALLTVDAPGFFEGMQTLAFGDLPALDSTVYAYGYPIGGERMSVTRGVVSRIEFRPYAHSGLDAHLAIQIDAAINPGNSGGPVIQDGKVIGVAFQGFGGAVAQNTAYMIPTPVVTRFLQDVEDGRYDGYVELAVEYQNLLNPAYRAYLGLPDDQTGVVVDSVLTVGSAAKVIEPGDVLLKIDGHPIASDGHIVLAGEYVQLEEIVERKFHGDTVLFDIVRSRQPRQVKVTLKGAAPHRIMARQYDVRPRFILFAGLLFQPLDREFLSAYKIQDPEITYWYSFFVSEELYLERPEIVVLSNILSDPVNTYLDGFKTSIVDTVNDVPIKSLRDLDAALSAVAERYVIRVLGHGLPIVIEADRLAEATARIARQYQVTIGKYLGPEGAEE